MNNEPGFAIRRIKGVEVPLTAVELPVAVLAHHQAQLQSWVDKLRSAAGEQPVTLKVVDHKVVSATATVEFVVELRKDTTNE